MINNESETKANFILKICVIYYYISTFNRYMILYFNMFIFPIFTISFYINNYFNNSIIMFKNYFFLSTIFLHFSIAATAQTVNPVNNYMVHLAGFSERVPNSYFQRLSGESVREQVDSRGIYHYYSKNYAMRADAETMLQRAIDNGYAFARVVSLADLDIRCNASCEKKEDLTTLQNIFYDFDSPELRADSRAQLNRLKTVLGDHPDWTCELRAYTDSTGSDEYNDRLSVRRAANAKNYLTSHGISSSRIKTGTFGEKDPIAKNEINGQDTEQGRQFNRRVQIYIYNAQNAEMNALVEPINVPDSLKN